MGNSELSMVAAENVVSQMDFDLSSQAAGVLDELGRTEDIRFSPDNSYFAIVGFLKNRFTLFALDIDKSVAVPKIRVTKALEVASSHLKYPHGIDFLDSRTMAVANRRGSVSIFRIPENFAQLEIGSVLNVSPIREIRRANFRRRLRMPGSVCVVESNGRRTEMLVCDNHKSFVSRHVIDLDHRFLWPRNQMLLKAGLHVPDGIALSSDKRWIAVSNHATHQIFIYDRNRQLDFQSVPDGMCEGVLYPHGLRFAPDGRALYVADAGQPYVHRFVASGGDWAGNRISDAKARVMDDVTFQNGRSSPQEGGPKGLDVTADGRLLVVTSEHQPFGLFHLSEMFS